MLKIFNCDLHIHTCLSPCAELDMHPRNLMEKALAAKLDMIAICDHNSSANVPYVIRAAAGSGVTVIPGMEITSSEEVHLLALFGSLPHLAKLQSLIEKHLFGENDEKRFGVQAIVNEFAEVEGICNQLLIGATDLSLDELVNYIHEFEGLAIAAHIDRESFSVISQLGFIDETAHFDALEITPVTGISGARARYRELAAYSFIVSSDAHFINDVGSTATKILLREPSFAELKLALGGKEGRSILEQ